MDAAQCPVPGCPWPLAPARFSAASPSQDSSRLDTRLDATAEKGQQGKAQIIAIQSLIPHIIQDMPSFASRNPWKLMLEVLPGGERAAVEATAGLVFKTVRCSASLAGDIPCRPRVLTSSELDAGSSGGLLVARGAPTAPGVGEDIEACLLPLSIGDGSHSTILSR